MKKIINIEEIYPEQQVKTCSYLNSNELGAAICINKNLSLCYPKSDTTVININDYTNIDLKDFIQKRKDFFLKLNNAETDVCNNCPFLKEKSMKDVCLDSISWLNIANFTTCNLRCKYCYFSPELLGAKLEKKDRQLLPIVKNMAAQGVLTENVCLAIAGGEPTLFEDIPETLEFLKNNFKQPRFNLQSNSTLTSNIENIMDAIKTFPSNWKNLYTSVDAGTPETYKKIRGRDLYKALVNNLYNYARNGVFTHMQLKYILLDDADNDMYNLSYKDVWGFCKLVAKIVLLNPNNTMIVLDRNLFQSEQRFSPKMLEAASIMSFVAKQLNINIHYSACGYISSEDVCLIEELASCYKKRKKTLQEMLLFYDFMLISSVVKMKKVLKVLKKLGLILRFSI